MTLITFIRGGGDLASGAALRLYRAGLQVVILELPQPLVVRRTVSFAEAVYSSKTMVENIPARLVQNLDQALLLMEEGVIPVLVDPHASAIAEYCCSEGNQKTFVVVDARMIKKSPDVSLPAACMLIGLGPGFVAGENCDAVVETKRGHTMGRVYWIGSGEADTGIPDNVHGIAAKRVLRAPANGTLITHNEIGDHLEERDLIAEIQGIQVRAPFKGILRGLLHPGIAVEQGMKLGDVDPRDDPALCRVVSDKSLAVGGGVLEAILSKKNLRPDLWDQHAPE